MLFTFVLLVFRIAHRRFLVEKARSAALLGILLGTGGSPDLNQATANLRALVRAAGKHSYTVVIGKPSPHKLANFPEVRVHDTPEGLQGMPHVCAGMRLVG